MVEFKFKGGAEMVSVLEKELSNRVIGAAFHVIKELGIGLLEKPYKNAMAIALNNRGVAVQKKVKYPVYFEGFVVGEYFADLVVEKKIIMECKAIKELREIHTAQLINYLHISGISSRRTYCHQ